LIDERETSESRVDRCPVEWLGRRDAVEPDAAHEDDLVIRRKPPRWEIRARTSSLGSIRTAAVFDAAEKSASDATGPSYSAPLRKLSTCVGTVSGGGTAPATGD